MLPNMNTTDPRRLELVREYVQICTSVADVSTLPAESIMRLRAIERELGCTAEEVLTLASAQLMADVASH
jgi:hypothetical protein